MSALTTASVAVTPVAYWPMEDAGGAITAADVGPNSLPLSLAGAGASAHILPGQAAQVPGAAGSWSSDGTAGTYLTAVVGGGSPLQIAGAFTLAGWMNLTAVPSALVIGRTNNWFLTLQPYLNGGAWSSATAYATGALVQSGGQGWRSLRPQTNVTPGTDGTAWEAVFYLIGRAKLTTGGVQAITSDVIALNTPTHIALLYTGYEFKLRVNTVEQGAVFLQDTITATTDPFGMFGTNANAFTGFAWGWGVWSQALDRGTIRSIYEAGVGAGNVTPSAPFLDTVQDTITPAITGSAITYKCAGCTGKIRAAEGYLTISGARYHHGCYHARRLFVNPSILTAASTLTDLADRTARIGYDFLQIASRRTLTDKPFYHDGTQFQPVQQTSTFWRSQTSLGAFAAMLARSARASRESWLVDLGRRTAEFIISTQIGVSPSIRGAGVSLNASTGAVSGSNPAGMYAISFDTVLNAQSWVLRDLCLIYLALKRVMPAATLARWQQSIVAGATFLHSGSFNQPVGAAPYLNDQVYVNGNYQIRYAQCYWLAAQVTGDASWLTLYNTALSYALNPYGTALTWQGLWAATTSYNATNSPNGPHAVRRPSGAAYQCIASIAGSSGNSPPESDPTHWQLLEANNFRNRQGMGLVIVNQGADATNWSDYWGYLTEYGSGAGGGPPGSALAGQPGYDGDYNSLQLDVASSMWLLTKDARWKQLANLLMNQAGLYPSGGTNPQSAPFTHTSFATTPTPGSTTIWATDRTSGANGGYSTRHNLIDGFREPWLAISILTGARPDLNAAFPWAQYASHVEPDFKNGWVWTGFTENVYAMVTDVLAQYLLAAPSWPGF